MNTRLIRELCDAYDAEVPIWEWEHRPDQGEPMQFTHYQEAFHEAIREPTSVRRRKAVTGTAR